MRRFSVLLLLFLSVTTLPLTARERTLCEGDGCTDNSLQVVFGNAADASSRMMVAAGDTLALTVISDVVDASQGWSMGVAHDTSLVRIDSVSIDDLTLPAEFFNTTVIAVGDPGPGFIAAFVTAIFLPGASLEPGDDIPLVEASYTILANVPAGETSYFEFVDNLVPNPGSPPTATNFTVSSSTRKPRTVTDGEIFSEGPPGCDGPDWALNFGSALGENATVDGDTLAVNMRNAAETLGLSFGVSYVDGTLEFASEQLGTAEDRLIENIITDIEGRVAVPSGNSATDAEAREVLSVDRGSAIDGITGDFFTVNLSPEVGGPGFTVGYVVDVSGTETTIPATGTDGDGNCELNEIVVITFGEGEELVPFFRADTDGNGKVDVTDAAVNVQNIFLNRVIFFDCDDMLDANDDGELNTADPITILSWLFLGDAPPAAPFRTCDVDTTADELGCNVSNCEG